MTRIGSSSSEPTWTAWPAGPGINDNGSGSGTILEIAETFAAQGREARNKLRFMWYSAEESGLIGSDFYVDQPRVRPSAARSR